MSSASSSRTRYCVEVLDLLSTEDDFDWNDSKVSDIAEDEIDYQAVWEPHNPLDVAEEQANFDEQYVGVSCSFVGLSEEPVAEERCQEQVIEVASYMYMYL